jgi:hypothetical protein
MLYSKITDVHYENRVKHMYTYTPRGKCGIVQMLQEVLFLLSTPFRPTRGPTQPPTQWVLGVPSPG